jgi:hypothetical protein
MIKTLLLFLACTVILSSPTAPAIATQDATKDSVPTEEPTPAPDLTLVAAPAYGHYSYNNNYNYFPSVNRRPSYSYPAYNYQQHAPLASPVQQQPAFFQRANFPSLVNQNSMNTAVYNPYNTYVAYNNPFSQYQAWSADANPNATSASVVPVNQPVMNQQAYLNSMHYHNNAPRGQYNPTYNAPLSPNFQSSASQPVQYASQMPSRPYFSFSQPSTGMPLAQPMLLRNVYGNPADPIFDFQQPAFDYQPMRVPFQALPTQSASNYGMQVPTTYRPATMIASKDSEQQPAATTVDATSSNTEATSIPKYIPYSMPRQAYNFIPYTAPNYSPYSYNSFSAPSSFAATRTAPAAQVAVAPTVEAAPGASV